LISSKASDAFLALVRLGIGHGFSGFPKEVDWTAIKALADQHGLSAIILDGIENLPEKSRPSKEILLNWIGEILQDYEQRYDLYRKTIAELAGWHNAHGFKMMVLKGYACAMNWPKPEHRPCGDIDIWQFGQQREADTTLSKENRVKIDSDHHHHTVFIWRDFTVENHYDFLNVHHHKSNVELETILKDLGQDDSHYVELFGEKVYLPSPNLHALFLLRHSMSNFASTRIQIRQLLDWAFFVKTHHKDIDWVWLEKILNQYGMKKLYDVFNAICVGDLGFDVNIFPKVQYDPMLKEKVRNEVFYPAINYLSPENFFLRIAFKFHRWVSSEWKHRLCYNDSMWSAFWSGVKSHLLKPSSI